MITKIKTYTVGQLFHTGWTDLSPAQFIQLVQLREILVKTNGRSSHAAFVKTHMLQVLCKKLHLFSKITIEQMFDLFPILEFIEKPGIFYVIDNLYLDGLTYRAPKPKLEGMSLWQLIEADAAFSKFLITQDAVDGIMFVKKLYTPFSGRSRNRLHPSIAVPAIALNYSANRQWMTETCTELFPPADDDTVETPSGSSLSQFTGPLWMSLLFNLADTPAFQGMERAKLAPAMEALLYLNQRARENKG